MMSVLSGLLDGAAMFLAASVLAATQFFTAPVPAVVSNVDYATFPVASATTSDVVSGQIKSGTTIDTANINAPMIGRSSPLLLQPVYRGMSDEDINVRFVGFLSHVQWLLKMHSNQNTPMSDVSRLERQVFSLMDDVSDSFQDVSADIDKISTSTTTIASLTDPIFNTAIASNLPLGNFWLSGDGDSEGLTVDSAGLVGIGTKTPTRLLTVAGDMSLTGALYDAANSLGSAGMILQTTGTSTHWVSTSTLGMSGSGGLAAADIDTSSKLSSILGDESGTGTVAYTHSPIFITPNLGTPSVLTLSNATGLSILTGVAGLGTNVATFLSVPTSANVAAAVTDATGSGSLVFATSPTLVTPRTAVLYGGTSTSSVLTLKSTSGVGTTDAIVFGVGNNGGTESMRLFSTGNIAIGTSIDSGSKLTVFSGAASNTLTLINAASNPRILFSNSAVTNFSSIGQYSNGLSLSGGSDPTTGSSIFINDSGNVGIGTVNPTALLSIGSTTGSQFLVTNLGVIASGTWNGSFLTVPYGGTGITDYAVGDILYAIGTTTLARRAAGVTGQVLQVIAGLPTWVATSSLGFISGATTVLALTDTPASFSANRILYTNSGATALVDSTNFTYNGTDLTVGATNGLAWGGTRMLAASVANDTVSIGRQAGVSNTGTFNNIFGFQAGNVNTGLHNNMFGTYAGFSNTGNYNNLIGRRAGYNNTGSYSEMYGHEVAARMSASYSIIIGGAALRGGAGLVGLGNNATTTNNTVIGYSAGYNVLSGGDNNILLGFQTADSLTTGANNIIIGYDVEAPSNTASNQLNIGNLIFGTGINGTGTAISSGNIGIGTTSPNSKLTVSGDIKSTSLLGGATTLSTDALGNIIRTPSDERLKENVATLEHALDKILLLRGVSYDWKDKLRFGDQTEVGFIAQEVNQVVPEVVRQGGDYWSLNTPNLLALVVEAIKEMWTKIQGQDTRLSALETENQKLKERLNALENIQTTNQSLLDSDTTRTIIASTTNITDTINVGTSTESSIGAVDSTSSESTVIEDDIDTEVSKFP